MRKTKLKNTLFVGMLIVVTAFQNANAQTEPLGGKPAPGSKPSVTDLEYQVKYQRAFEAVLWSMPAIGIYGFHRASELIGAGSNVILAMSGPAKPNNESLTANNQVPYIASQTDLRKGPVVVEIPAASEKASLYGQIVDHWQITIADVGPSGVDQGKGGKILLTPPGYSEPVADEYIEIKSPSYRLTFAFRSVPGPESSQEEAYEYAKTMKMYYLSELPNPAPTKFMDPIDMRYSTLPQYDETWFEELYKIFSVEKVYPRDKVMMGMLASLGIQKGKPYNPDEKTQKAMQQAAIDAYFYMQQRFLNPKDPERIWWKDKHWYDVLYHDGNNTFVYEYPDRVDIDNRADRYYWGTYFPKAVSEKPAVYYLYALADKNGDALKGGETYSLTVPAEVPIKQFWSLNIYDLETFAFIYNPLDRAGLSSLDLPNMQKNDDGSVTLYFGPKAPKELESNWIPTEGKLPLPVMRLYGPTDKFYDRSWELPDVNLVK